MNPQSAIQKGKELEKYVVDELGAHGLDNRATRQPGSGNGLRKGDVNNDLGWCIECKNTKNFKYKEAAEQVRREGMGFQKEVIIWHPPGRPLGDSIAIINMHDFFDLLKDVKDGRGKGEILETYQVKRHLEQAIFHLRSIKNDL